MLKLITKEKSSTVDSLGNRSTSVDDFKKPRSAKQNESVSSSNVWSIKYRPKNVKELVMHSSKVKAIRAWIQTSIDEMSLSQHQESINDSSLSSANPHVLILCGNSGCCKSTAVELICEEMNVDIKVWSENEWDTTVYNNHSNRNYYEGYNTNHLKSSSSSYMQYPSKYDRELFNDMNESKDEQMRNFAVYASYNSLNLSVIRPVVTHTTTASAHTISAHTNNTKSFNSNSSSSSSSRNKPSSNTINTTNSSNGTRSRNTISPNTFQYSRSNSDSIANRTYNGQIVLIHDPPILNYSSASASGSSTGHSTRLDEIKIDSELLGRTVSSLTLPVVIILSDLAGREDVRYQCENCIASKYRHRYVLHLSVCTRI